MNNQEKLDKLQCELNEMKEQFRDQIRRINEVQQELWTLGSKEPQQVKPPEIKRWSLENFIGLNLIHFIGIIVLVIGLSIGVKYAIDRELISETLRIVLAYAAGFALYFISLKLRSKYTGFSAILLSGGMASIYFTTYAAFVYYQMFSLVMAFMVMVVLTGYTVYEAHRYIRQEIALLGLTGAYAIPFLISRNEDRADLFFLYITLINLAVVYLTIRKKWKTVGSVAQALTWILFLGWALTRIEPDQQGIGYAFMICFFLLFHFSFLAFRIIYKQKLLVNDTYGLLLNNVALYLVSLCVYGASYLEVDNIAGITLVMSVVFALQAGAVYGLWKDEKPTYKLHSLLALSLFVFFIALNWDGFTVTFLWLLTAVILFLLGFRIRSVQARLTAMVLIGLTLAKLLVVDSSGFTTIQKVIAYLVIGILLLLVSFFYQKFRKQLFGEESGER